MTHKQLLEQIGELIIVNNVKLLLAVDEKIQASEARLRKDIRNAIRKDIDDSQKDTIETLTELMNSGYTNHEARLVRVEDELCLPPLKHS